MDKDWDSFIESRVALIGNLNAYSQDWIIHCKEIRDAAELERLVDTYHLILSNEPEKATRSTQRKMTLMIDLTFTSARRQRPRYVVN